MLNKISHFILYFSFKLILIGEKKVRIIKFPNVLQKALCLTSRVHSICTNENIMRNYRKIIKEEFLRFIHLQTTAIRFTCSALIRVNVSRFRFMRLDAVQADDFECLLVLNQRRTNCIRWYVINFKHLKTVFDG